MVGSNGWLFVFAQFFERTTEKTHMRTKDTLNQESATLTLTKISNPCLKGKLQSQNDNNNQEKLNGHF
jgi:hypothetical protein